MASVRGERTGFCAVDVKLFGPVQLNVPPAGSAVAVRFTVPPTHPGPSFPATSDGGVMMLKCASAKSLSSAVKDCDERVLTSTVAVGEQRSVAFRSGSSDVMSTPASTNCSGSYCRSTPYCEVVAITSPGTGVATWLMAL